MRTIKGKFCWLMVYLGLFLPGFASFQAEDKAISGYWQIKSPDATVVGVMRLQVHADHLLAHGMRVNVISPDKKITWTCKHGDKLLQNQSVWGGGVLLDMERDHNDPSFFYNGVLRSAVGCQVVRPEVVFTSEKKAVLTVTKTVDFYDMDKSFVFNVEYELEKITKREALQGCKYIISGADKRRWGDLVNSENARQKMLKDLKLSKQTWLAHANNYNICFDG